MFVVFKILGYNVPVMKIQKPKLATILEPFDNDLTVFDEGYIQDIKFDKESLESLEKNDIKIDSCCFKDSILKDSELENVHFIKANLYRIRFINCRCMGIEITDSLLKNVLFDSCNAAYSNFGLSSFKNVLFHHTNLENSGFIQCMFDHLEFDRACLNNSDFFNTNLDKIDFSSSDINNIGVSENLLKGIILSPEQALEFIKLLGIKVKE